MLVRKMLAAALEVDKVYVAFSAKSKMLSSNGDKGVFVKVVEIAGKDVKVNILHNNRVMTIKNIDGRADAWIYNPDTELKININAENKRTLFPKFTDRMWDAFQGKELKFVPDNVYKHEREGEGFGQTFYRFRGDDGKTNTFNFGWVSPALTPEWRVPRAQRMGVGAVEVKLPPKPVSAEEEELIKTLSAPIEEFNKNKNYESTASYLILSKELKNVGERYDYNAPCHASLSRSHGGRYVISVCKTDEYCNGLSEHDIKRYITYLTCESPFAPAFLVKNADWIYENGYILTGYVSAQLLGGACIATRQAWEYPIFIKAWLGLAEQGIPLNLAYVFGSYATKNREKWGFGAGGGGHNVFSFSRMDEQALVNFSDGKVVKENAKPYHQDNNYTGVNSLWGGSTKAEVLNSLSSIGGAVRFGVKEGLSFEDAMEQAADIIEDWMKKEGV